MEPTKYKYIDVMRGIAVVMVVVCHTAAFIDFGQFAGIRIAQLGQLGVQLFFVGSALTLCLSMSKRGSSHFKIKEFYVRRFFRIAPLYYFGIALYGFLTSVHLGYGIKTSIFNIVFNICLVQGLDVRVSTNIVPGGWSIGTEILFYIAFPLIFRFVNTKQEAFRFVIVILTVDLFLQSVRCLIQGKPVDVINDSFMYFLILNQLPVFGCGILLYYLLHEEARMRPIFDYAIFFALMVVEYILWQQKHFGLAFAVIPSIAGIAFIFLGRGLSQAAMQSKASNMMAEVGKKSYSIYILHFIFAWYITHPLCQTLAKIGLTNSDALLIIASIVNTALTYLFAFISNRFIENTGIELGRKVIHRIDQRRLTVVPI